ncbi:MAG: hypothetical protein IPP71_02120 [Bacteroidetes bacterium]|nr:hypothetical protein [Bacteroidota bacterium]
MPKPSEASVLTNQSYFHTQLVTNGVHVIDFDAWFVKQKPFAAYPLIPKYGAHWSTYGAALAADSILKVIQSIKNKTYSSFNIHKVEKSEKAKFTDDDYLASLNLMKKWPSPSMAYPSLKFIGGKKPNVLIVSDSFIWNLFDLEIFQNCFDSKSQVWYYNKTVFDYGKNNMGPVSASLPINAIQNRDIIILIATGPSLKDFGYNFFEQVKTLDRDE